MFYLSGIPQLNKQDVRAFIKFDAQSISIEIPLGGKVRILKEDLLSVQEKTEDQITKDVTLTRLLTFGIFAFGMKKKRRNTEKYLILTYLDSGQEMIAVFRKHSQLEFRSLFDAVKEGQNIRNARRAPAPASYYPSPAPAPAPAPYYPPTHMPASTSVPIVASESILDQISQLNELRKEGAITEEEYIQMKAKILGNL